VLLKRILKGEFEATLPEFLRLSAAEGYIMPPETLPALLGLGKQELRGLVLPVLGERGRWLAHYNPAWAYALPPGAEEDWETGSLAQRISLLESLRARTPERALDLLKSTWAADSPEARATFLRILAAGLGRQDEPFLESCLDDRRKEVREAALELLARLPESRQVGRAISRLEACLRFKSKFLGGETLEVSPPEEPDPAARRDAASAPPLSTRLGEKANDLAQTLGRVPPSVWCLRWKRPAEKILQAALDSEWKEALLLGWRLAVERSGDPDWAEALLALTVKQPEARKILAENGLSSLTRFLSAAKLEALTQASITPRLNELDEKHPMLDLLESCPAEWSSKLTRTVMGRLKRLAGKGLNWRLMRALPLFALHIPVALTGECIASWPEGNLHSSETWIEQFNALLAFRREIREAIPTNRLESL
jgi:hypothetical protein